MSSSPNPLRAVVKGPAGISIFRGDLYVGGLTRRFDGTWASYVNSVGTKFSTKKYPTAEDAAKARWKNYGRDAVRAALAEASP